jgi:predicted transcriptional regulator
MDKQSYKLLKLYAKRSGLSLSQLSAVTNRKIGTFLQTIDSLKQSGYLEIEKQYALRHETEKLPPEAPLVITDAGKQALKAEKKARRYFAWNETRGWLTLAIAAAALVLSIVK